MMRTNENRHSLFLSSHGGIGDEIGRGREKTATAVGENKVVVEYHSKENEVLAIPEYSKAQFYMHKILHLLLPNNFPNAIAASGGKVLLERIPDSPDLQRARRINSIFMKYHDWSRTEPGDEEWWRKKQRENAKNDEFQRAIRFLNRVRLLGGVEYNEDEFRLPINTTMRDSHPVLLEIIKPIVSDAENYLRPRMNLASLENIVALGIQNEYLSISDGKRIRALAKRYQINALEACKVLDRKDIVIY